MSRLPAPTFTQQLRTELPALGKPGIRHPGQESSLVVDAGFPVERMLSLRTEDGWDLGGGLDVEELIAGGKHPPHVQGPWGRAGVEGHSVLSDEPPTRKPAIVRESWRQAALASPSGASQSRGLGPGPSPMPSSPHPTAGERREGVNASVSSDVQSVFKGKT